MHVSHSSKYASQAGVQAWEGYEGMNRYYSAFPRKPPCHPWGCRSHAYALARARIRERARAHSDTCTRVQDLDCQSRIWTESPGFGLPLTAAHMRVNYHARAREGLAGSKVRFTVLERTKSWIRFLSH